MPVVSKAGNRITWNHFVFVGENDRRQKTIVCPTSFFCHPARTGPFPLLRSFHQAGLYGVVFDVSDQILEFLRGADPVIERLILPERCPRAAQNPVCHAAGSALSHRMMAGMAA